MLAFLLPQYVPAFAGVLTLMGVAYFLGIYTGSYMFPIIKIQPPTPIPPETQAKLDEIHRKICDKLPTELDRMLETHNKGND